MHCDSEAPQQQRPTVNWADEVDRICGITYARADARMGEASDVARGLRELSDSGRKIMRDAFDVEDTRPTFAAAYLRTIRRALAKRDQTVTCLQLFRAEHGELLEPGTVEGIFEFYDWLKAREVEFTSRASALRKAISDSLEASRAENSALESDWDLASGDGVA